MKRTIIYLVIGVVSLFLTFNLHSRTGTFNYESELWADCSGYYIYLPATLIYRLDPARFPEKIDQKTGYGFVLDGSSGTFRTKYTCGVAILMAPFFITAMGISEIAGIPAEGGFSPLFHRMADVVGIFYLLLGMALLQRVLDRYFSKTTGYLTVFSIMAATSLFYYAFRYPVMSHVYSFFLCSLFLWFLHRYLDKGSLSSLAGVAFSAALATLVRPTNIILVLLLFLWDTGSLKDVYKRFRSVMKPLKVLILLLAFIVVMIPQALFWKYMFGKYFVYSYAGEGFSNLAAPKLAEIWFAPLNGLFLYNPAYLLVIAGMIWMLVKAFRNGWLFAGYFLLVSYICASWHCWYFGCSYGQRLFVDFLPLFAFPLGFIINRQIISKKVLLPAIFFLLLAGSVYYNIRLSYTYRICFEGSAWDWPQYGRELKRAGLFSPDKDSYVFTNDFENDLLTNSFGRTESMSRSGSFSARLDQEYEFSCRKSYKLFQFDKLVPRFADVNLWVQSPAGPATGAHIVCWLDREGKTIFWKGIPLDSSISLDNAWTEVRGTFALPDSMRWDDQLSINIWNPKHQMFFIDDLKITYYSNKTRNP